LQRPAKITYPREAAPRVTGGALQRAAVVPLYNGAGALERVTVDGQEFVSHIAYNARGQRVLVAYGNGLMTRYAYDDETFRLARMRTEAFDRVQPWLWRGHGSPLQDSTYSYDPMGNLVEIEDRTTGCGVAAEGRSRLRREFGYDPLYRLTSAKGRAAAGTGSARPLDDVAAAGSYPSGPPAPTDANAPDLTELYEESYELDPVGNLLKLTYDAASGRWSRRFGIDGQPPAQWTDAATNRVTDLRVGTSTPSTYAYDANGNLLRQNLDRFHTWDHADRLVGYQVMSGAVPSVDARYLYGADGERVKKWVRRNGAGDAETTVYVDGVFELHRWREGGAQKRQNHLHVLDNRSRVAIVRVGHAANDEGGPPVQYHLGDHVGSSAVVVDDSGNWLNREEYFPYGETSFGSFSRKRYRFVGRERDRESSLSYHGARYYAPWLARWTSCDPAETVDGVNLYRYARSSPLSFSDTSGKQSQTTTPTPQQQQRPPPDVQTLRDPQPTATTALERLGGREVNTPEHAEAVKAVVNWALQKATEAATDPKTGAITKTRREIFVAALERVVALRKGHLPESAQNLIYRDADHYLAGRYVEYMAGAKEGLRVGGGKDAPISETSAAMSPFVILGYDVLKELGNYKQVTVGGKHFLSTTEGVDPAPAGGQEWALLGVHDFIRYDRDKQTDKSAPEPVTQTPTERFVEALKPKPYKPKPSVLETLVHSMTAELGL
jgi:RHS repeat-associated protein